MEKFRIKYQGKNLNHKTFIQRHFVVYKSLQKKGWTASFRDRIERGEIEQKSRMV